MNRLRVTYEEKNLVLQGLAQQFENARADEEAARSKMVEYRKLALRETFVGQRLVVSGQVVHPGELQTSLMIPWWYLDEEFWWYADKEDSFITLDNTECTVVNIAEVNLEGGHGRNTIIEPFSGLLALQIRTLADEVYTGHIAPHPQEPVEASSQYMGLQVVDILERGHRGV